MGNFQIVRVEKVKTMSSVAARGRHNFREQDTPNADGFRLGLNVVEGAKNTDELCSAVFGLLPEKHRKDAVVCLEYLVTASPEHFGADWRESGNFGEDYFKDAIAWLEAKHGKGSVVCKTVHLDESTPHLAAFVVPLVAGKLNAKAFTGGAKALADMQTDFNNKVGVKHGLLRGEFRSKAVHQDNAKIKPMVAERLELRKQVKALTAEVERLAKSVGGGSAALDVAREALAKMEKEYAGFKARTQATLDQANNYIKTLFKEKKDMAKELQTASARDHGLVAEITALREENATAVASLEQLRAIDRVLVDQARERLAPPEPVVVDNRAEQEALLAAHQVTGEATPAQAKTGVVKASCAGLCVLSLGRGVLVSHRLAAGVVATVGKDLNERHREGITR